MSTVFILAAVVLGWLWLRSRTAPAPGDASPGSGAPPPAPAPRPQVVLRNEQTGQMIDINHPDAPPFIDTNVWKPIPPAAAPAG